jgi:hypothetical protein
MALPLYGFVQGDTLGLIVLAGESESVSDLAQRLARAAAPRVALGERLRVLHRGSLLRGDLTLTEAGIRALDRVDVLAEVDGG